MATFVSKFVAENFQKSPNLVTLLSSHLFVQSQLVFHHHKPLSIYLQYFSLSIPILSDSLACLALAKYLWFCSQVGYYCLKFFLNFIISLDYSSKSFYNSSKKCFCFTSRQCLIHHSSLSLFISYVSLSLSLLILLQFFLSIFLCRYTSPKTVYYSISLSLHESTKSLLLPLSSVSLSSPIFIESVTVTSFYLSSSKTVKYSISLSLQISTNSLSLSSLARLSPSLFSLHIWTKWFYVEMTYTATTFKTFSSFETRGLKATSEQKM